MAKATDKQQQQPIEEIENTIQEQVLQNTLKTQSYTTFDINSVDFNKLESTFKIPNEEVENKGILEKKTSTTNIREIQNFFRMQ